MSEWTCPGCVRTRDSAPAQCCCGYATDAEDQVWLRIGRYDSARRRSLWMHCPTAYSGFLISPVILRAGREGDDAYVELREEDFVDPAKWRDFADAMSRARYAAEDDDDE